MKRDKIKKIIKEEVKKVINEDKINQINKDLDVMIDLTKQLIRSHGKKV